jgi:hypothetical protein
MFRYIGAAYAAKYRVVYGRVVLIGTVKQVDSARDAARGRIYTYVTLTKLEVVKGKFSDNTYVLRMSGGTVGNVAQRYPGMPRFAQGERYIIFVRGNFSDTLPVVGLQQGIFHVVWDPERQQEVVRPIQGEIINEGNRGQLQQRQEALQENVTVAQFVQRVQERLRALQQGRQEPPGDSTQADPTTPGGATR